MATKSVLNPSIVDPAAKTDLLRSFARTLDAENKSPRTKETYTDAVRFFAQFLRDSGMPLGVFAITREHVEAFIADQLTRWKPATAHNRHRSLSAFFQWCVSEGDIRESPMARMRPPMVPEQLVDVLTDDQLRALIRACQGSAFEHRRDLALILMLIDTGLRRQEMASLLLDHLDLDTRRVVASVTKNRRPRVVPYGRSCARALDRYLRVRAQHRDADSPSLWLGQRGDLGLSGVMRVVRLRGRSAGIVGMHTHVLRHTWVDRLLSGDTNDHDVQVLAGWTGPAMLGRYAASRAAQRAVENYQKHRSPGDRL